MATTADGVVFPGDCVEIFGLTSQAGQELNGLNGIATKILTEAGRIEVRVGADRRVTVRPENLRCVQKGGSKVTDKLGFGAADRKAECEAASAFRPGDLVEAFDLPSTQRELDGKQGTVVEDSETPPDRVKVRFDLGSLMEKEKFRHATLRPGNLSKVYLAGLTDEQRAKLQSLGNGREGAQESVQENVQRSQLNRLGAQERHLGKDLFTRVDLVVDPRDAGPAQGASWPLDPGDVVEVSGLSSAAGQRLNGVKGVVLACLMEDGRAEVRLADGHKKLKFANLSRLDLASGDRFMVEVHGLQSDSGRPLNGQRGIAVSRNGETGRFEVKLSKDKVVSFKPDNLRLLNKAA